MLNLLLMKRWLGAVMGLSLVACGHAAVDSAGPKQPMGTLTVTRMQGPEDAPEEAKTVKVEYTFNRDLLNKDLTKTFKDGFDKHGVKVDQLVVAKSHFDVKDAKITGTVTYVKKGFAHYSILAADLVATGHYDADVQVDVDVQAKGDTRKAEKELSGTILGGKPIPIVKNMMPTNIPIAGPLFLHAHFDLSAACEMGVEGQVHATTGVGVTGDVRLAAYYKKSGFDKANGKKSRFQFEAKTPNFELSPKPYLQVEGKQQSVHGKCSLQPTTVLLMEKMVGAKLSVEPYVELDAKRPSSKAKWQVDAQAGISLNAATDVQVFGRRIGKPKEYTLYDLALTKKGDPPAPPPVERPHAGVPEAIIDTAPADVPANEPSDPPPVVAEASATANTPPPAVEEAPKVEEPKVEEPKAEEPKANDTAILTDALQPDPDGAKKPTAVTKKKTPAKKKAAAPAAKPTKKKKKKADDAA